MGNENITFKCKKKLIFFLHNESMQLAVSQWFHTAEGWQLQTVTDGRTNGETTVTTGA
jgi:hypothetical protein